MFAFFLLSKQWTVNKEGLQAAACGKSSLIQALREYSVNLEQHTENTNSAWKVIFSVSKHTSEEICVL